MLLVFAIVNYLVGSIPFALVIGKLFYKTDVRNYGSGNLGATNAGRVLGKNVAFIVAILDASKGLILFLIESLISYQYALYSIFFVAIGHCFPIFANFKGGKAVATTFGIILGLSLGSVKTFLLVFVLPLLIWYLIGQITGYISLASIVSIFLSALIALLISPNKAISLVIFILWLFMCIRHKENIKRLIKGEENKKNY